MTKSFWKKISDENLLETKICDLKLSINKNYLKTCIQKLYKELKSKRIIFRPPCFLADEWFVPESDTLIGIPFYLAHPRLNKIELKMMHEVEGGHPSECLKLLRHEAGHALFYAYAIHRKKEFHQIFGKLFSPRKNFRPNPHNKNFVKHLPDNYAQTDRDEDFAETFAVWLTPKSNWKKIYKNSGALKKLEFIDKFFDSVANKKPVRISNKPYCEAKKLRIKLKTYYRLRNKRDGDHKKQL